MKKIVSMILMFACATLFGDVLTPAAPGDVKVLGRPGELFQASLNSRVFSEYAQGPVYDEAENAFAGRTSTGARPCSATRGPSATRATRSSPIGA